MEPIRVLQVVTTMDRAGLETMLMNYYRHMDRTKVQFDFLKHRDEPHAYDDEIRALGGRIYTVPAFNPLNTNGYLDALDSFFAEHREYRIVHSHLDCLSAVPLKYAKKHGIPTRVAHSHVSQMTFDAKYPIRVFYRAQIPAAATDLFACSDTAGQWMFGRRPYRVIPNAIACKAFAHDEALADSLRKEQDLDGKFVVVHVGRFDPVKNHAFLIDVFQEIVKQHENSVLLLAGVGSLMDQIREKVDACGLKEKVRFLGSVSDMPRLLQMADAFVFPSQYEGLGISLIEAQAAGLSCFASRGRVPADTNVTGTVQFLPLEDGPKIWADRILQAGMSSQVQTDHLQLLAQNGYDIDLEAEKLQNFYIQKYMEEI